jgi:hypothetical protein
MKRLIIAMSLLAVFCTAVMTVGYSDASAKTAEVSQSQSEATIHAVDFACLVFECPSVVELKQTMNYVPSVEFQVLTEKEAQGFIGRDRAPPKVRHRWS